MSGESATKIYSAIMAQIEARRISIGVAQEPLGQWSGIAERSYPKYLHPDTKSGRQASWSVLEALVQTLYPHGYEVEIRAVPGPLVRKNDLRAQLLCIEEKIARYQSNKARSAGAPRSAA